MTPFEASGPSLFKRLLIGAGLVIFASAGATAVAAFREVDRIVGAFKQGRQLRLGSDLATTNPGDPQTLMILGSDKRPRNSGDGGAGSGARSDTIILMRIDPKKKAIALMSLPRDLKVQIPGHGTDKINAAYELGGPRLTLKTVKRLTGLSINHVINIDFDGFYRGINAINCVYVDIDRRYYNNSGEFAYINVLPGYQRMCGRKALQYVRFRHEDTDLVRSARQQDFLREAKAQVGVGKLIKDRQELLDIFGKYTSSDIRSREEVLRLLKLAVFSAGHPVREVHFEGQITSGDASRGVPSYVTASNTTVQRLVAEFLGVRDSPGPRGELRAKGDRARKRRARGGNLNLENAEGAGRDQAIQAIQQGAGKRLPVLYPTLRTRGSLYAGPPRVYRIRTPNKRWYGAYRMVIKRGVVGEYYGLQGTRWRDPPILRNPAVNRKIGRRTYEIQYDGDRVRLVAWRTSKGVYWVSNTLLQTLNERQMIAIARSVRGL